MYISFQTPQGETLDRIFLSLQSQFKNFKYEKKEFFFVRTEQQVDKIIEEGNKGHNPIILYTIVETKLAKYLSKKSELNKHSLFWCFRKFNFSFFKAFKSKSNS